VAFSINTKAAMLFDGAMGTMLQKIGLKADGIPEELNLTHPDTIASIHREYLDAGADAVLANTFGANRYKAAGTAYSVKDLVSAGISVAKKAASGRGYVALDVGPTGRVMQPVGDMPFEEAVDAFAETVRAGDEAGADFILLETFTDLYELKAAVVAAKENSSLPLLATMSFEENGRTFFGTTVESMVLTLEAVGVDALGVNCSLGPRQLAPVVERILSASSIPVIVQPNAGLPVFEENGARYDVTPKEFAEYLRNFVEAGASIVGGCCGTTPEHIRIARERIAGLDLKRRSVARKTGVCSASKAVFFGDDVVIIGERLNPTGKKELQAALRASDMDFILREAIRQQDQGACVLDVNVGLPDIDEPALLERAVLEIQAVVDIPLQLDSSDCLALERASRIYNGKPLINSVNGKKESLERVLPIAKKYGAAVLGLTLDDDGIPKTAAGRLAIARKIIERAKEYDIPEEDVLIDCLTMTVSAQQDQASETLEAVRLVKSELGAKTVLGVSNVSYGLPARQVINRTMLAMALTSGLDAPIMNPGDAGMAETVAAFRVLSGKDAHAAAYIERFSSQAAIGDACQKSKEARSLPYAVSRGLRNEAEAAVGDLLEIKPPLAIIEEDLIPALDEVGRDYEAGKIFLPQLIKSAEAARASFERLRAALAKEGQPLGEQRRKIVMATVHGDIHDIGKNIVKIVMENYNFDVVDLGKDVPPEKVVEAVNTSGARLVGLSALMTTTVASMKRTIEMLRRECPGVRVMVGGAVLTPELAKYVGADCYARDAMDGVRQAMSEDI